MGRWLDRWIGTLNITFRRKMIWSVGSGWGRDFFGIQNPPYCLLSSITLLSQVGKKKKHSGFETPDEFGDPLL